ncbi:type I DNA topoisomerase (plasmid) [Synechocystis sp. B12]|nr:type I DNA topoisomerase [Synechocystis sp. B12]
MKLLIIESPNKREKLEHILGDGYQVRASFGHVRDLPADSLGVAVPSYAPTYVVPEKSAKHIDALRRAAASATSVLLATDPDREGEAIAWHIADELKLPNARRVTFNEITEAAVRAAVAAPRALDMHLVHAQEARRILDRLVGYEVSPAISERAGDRLSAGRVQSPAVKLLVDRERAIRTFTPTTHYGARLRFDGPAGPWTAEWDPGLSPDTPYLLDPTRAEAAAAARTVLVDAIEDTTARRAPPAPFSTSTLQQAAHTALKLKPAQTMELAQKLFEAGLITYMRTDSPNLSAYAIEAISAYAQANNLPAAPTPRTWKAKALAQEGHEAIRPTDVAQRVIDHENPKAAALYALIWRRAVASQLADAEYAVRTATLRATAPGVEQLVYHAKGRTLTAPGWLSLTRDDPTEDEANSDDAANPVPALSQGQGLHPAGGDLLTKTTKAAKRYTQATLVRALEHHGIGRPSTYASILTNIEARGYCEEDAKGNLSATPRGEQLVDLLTQASFGFVELDYTATLEDSLDQVAAGELGHVQVIALAHARLRSELNALPPPAVHACPKCEAPMRRRSGSKGAFWGCSAYPTCKHTAPDVAGAPGATGAPVPNTPEQPRTYLQVPYDDREKAKTSGARWDGERKAWFVLGAVPAALKKYSQPPAAGSKAKAKNRTTRTAQGASK